MKYLFLSLILLTSCGAEPTEETAKPTATQPSGSIDYQPEAAKEVVVEYRKDGESYAITVSDTSELPACEKSNSKQLAWVKTTEQFFSCEDASWVEVPMKKPEAVVGSQGEKGDKGEPGEDGADGQPVPANQWFDPITGQSWLIGVTIAEGALGSITPCSGDWRMPTKAETKVAVQHGLLIAAQQLHTQSQVWTDEFTPDSERIAIGANGISEAYAGLISNAGVACLKIAEGG
jgi:hypothetical protein